MGKILTGFEHEAAKPKGRDPEKEEAPAQEPMRGSRTLLANPSTDEKKTKRRIRRNASAEPELVDADPIGEDLWSTALLVQTPPVAPVAKTAWNPFKKDEASPARQERGPNGLPMCPHGDGEMKWDTGDESAYCPTHGHNLTRTPPRLSSLDMATEARLLDEAEGGRTVASSGDDLRHLAWSDLRYLKNFMQTLNGHGVLMNYTTDYGTTSAEGILHYDGETATVTNSSGTSISVPSYNVLRVEPSENPDYPAPHSLVGPDADPGGSEYNPISPLFHGLLPSGAMGSAHEAAQAIPDESFGSGAALPVKCVNCGHPVTLPPGRFGGDEWVHADSGGRECVQEDVRSDPAWSQGDPWPHQAADYGTRENPLPDEAGAIHELVQGFEPGKPKSISPQRQSLTPEHQQKLTGAYDPGHSSLDSIIAANAATLAALRGTK